MSSHRHRLLALAFALLPALTAAYPLDGTPATGIARLAGYAAADAGKIKGPKQPAGAHLKTADIQLALTDRKELELPPTDADLTRELVALIGAEAPRYGLALLDLSDPEHPVYAEHRGTERSNPGSVGKILVASALFQRLAERYPDDIEARRRALVTTEATADAWTGSDHHKVPFWDGERLTYRPLRAGDRANLYTWLDWMLSASANAAAALVQREILVETMAGTTWPVTDAAAKTLLDTTPRSWLSSTLARVMDAPVPGAGLDPDNLRQGSFFSAEGQRRVPGRTSHATPRELVRWLLRLEQGRIVDAFSSLEIKRLLYSTQRRIRYASSPALADAAVHFKSGSLFKCKPESGFTCKQYQGNAENWMNSVAIVESPAGSPRLRYLVAVTSNVLYRNSAVEHQTLATRIHELIARRHAAPAAPGGAPR